MPAGIYRIACKASPQFYVGAAEDINSRWCKHWKRLSKGNHENPALQELWNKFGASQLYCEVLELADSHRLREREQYYIDMLHPELNAAEVSSKRRGKQSAAAQLNVRIDVDVIDKLHSAAYLYRKSQRDVVQEALSEYFEKRDLRSEYQLHSTDNEMILMQLASNGIPTVIEVTKKNGISIEQVAENYRIKLKKPVAVIRPPSRVGEEQ